MDKFSTIFLLLATIPLAGCPSSSVSVWTADEGSIDVGDARGTDSATDVRNDFGPADVVVDFRDGQLEDQKPPTDVISDLGPGPDSSEDVKTDSIYPEDCCLVDSDCPSDSGFAWYCAGTEANEFGVCRAYPDIGRCYADVHCPSGWTCHGASWCQCGALCDMGFEGPGVCVPQNNDDCVAISESWVHEICNAASIVIFNGISCVEPCPGCCGCEPFCEYTFQTMAECTAKCEPKCSSYIGSLRELPFQYFVPFGGNPSCPEVIDRERCDSDMFCPIAELGESGNECVLGNCVYCHSNTQCPGDKICRMGRCVAYKPEQCGFTAQCDGSAYCMQSFPSEVPCPLCICSNVFNKPCADDMECMVVSSHPYKRCVYGHCAECKDDNDCNPDQECAVPGRCVAKGSQAHRLWGTWLLGWYGGLNHFSYIRLEPDGTMRRGHYEPVVGWADDQLAHCLPEDYTGWPVFGYWTVESYDNTDGLVIDTGFVAPCEQSEKWAGSYIVTISQDGNSADFKSVINEIIYTAIRVSPDSCLGDFSLCESPVF